MATDAYNDGDGTKGTNFDDDYEVDGIVSQNGNDLTVGGVTGRVQLTSDATNLFHKINQAVDAAVEDAYSDGYDDGYADGYADGFKDGVDSVYNN